MYNSSGSAYDLKVTLVGHDNTIPIDDGEGNNYRINIAAGAARLFVKYIQF